MKIKQVVKELCKREGLKKQVDIAQITEIVGHLSDMLCEEYDEQGDLFPTNGVADALLDNGEKRAKKKKKKK